MDKDGKADEMRRNADNCAEMAHESRTRADKARFRRMESAWNDLAETQDWLDGKSEVNAEGLERGAKDAR